jgi:hypothetical protein
MHPCNARTCGHYRGVGGMTWLSSGKFKSTSAGKRSVQCLEAAAKNAKHTAKSNAKISERKTQARTAYESERNPELDLSAAALLAAGTAGIANFDVALASARTEHPSLAVNVFGASTGSERFSIEEEGLKSVLTTRGGDKPAIVATTAEGSRPLTPDERRTVGLVGHELYNAIDSTVLSKHVERAVQQHVDDLVKRDGTLKKLWRRTGAGGPKGIGPIDPIRLGFGSFPHTGRAPQ